MQEMSTLWDVPLVMQLSVLFDITIDVLLRTRICLRGGWGWAQLLAFGVRSCQEKEAGIRVEGIRRRNRKRKFRRKDMGTNPAVDQELDHQTE